MQSTVTGVDGWVRKRKVPRFLALASGQVVVSFTYTGPPKRLHSEKMWSLVLHILSLRYLWTIK